MTRKIKRHVRRHGTGRGVQCSQYVETEGGEYRIDFEVDIEPAYGLKYGGKDYTVDVVGVFLEDTLGEIEIPPKYHDAWLMAFDVNWEELGIETAEEAVADGYWDE